MKSNISQKEINSGKITINLIKKTNPLLSPHSLKKIIPEYKYFLPHINQYGLWISSHFNKNKNKKYDKIIFLLNGLAASGKDSLYNEITKLAPSLLFKTITGTSRLPRENEKNGIDYLFYKNKSEFKKDITKGEFIEYIKRGETYYGLPKKSLKLALKQPKPIIYCQIEMSGWKKLEEYIFSLDKNILIIRSFVLPYMTLTNYLEWLIQNRINDEITSRINKSGWEIKIAPTMADFFISNRINSSIPTLTYSAKTIVNLLISFLKSNKIKKFSTPTDNLKPTLSVVKIVESHNSLV